MRALISSALALLPALSQANTYEFNFSGLTFASTDSPPPYGTLDVSFLAKSDPIPFPAPNQQFNAYLPIYDVTVVVNGVTVETGGTGNFGFGGDEFGPYPIGEWIGGDWGFSSGDYRFGGIPDFGLGNPDPLNGASFVTDGVDKCYTPTSTECQVRGSSKLVESAVPLPATAWLLLAGLGGLGFRGRRRRAA